MRFLALAITTSLILPPSMAVAETMTLRNGDRISGTLLPSASASTISLQTAFGQIIKIPRTAIAQTQAPQASSFKLSPTPEMRARWNGQPVAAIPAVSTIIPPSVLTATPSTPITPSPKTTDASKKTIWSGRINFGASVQSGNTTKNAINADSTVKAKWNKTHRTTLKLEYNREKDEGTLTENNRSLDAIHDYFFKPQWFLNTTLGLEEDEIEQLDLRTQGGFGLGWQIFERDDLNLQTVLGPIYLREEFESGQTDSSLTARWALDYDQKIWSDKLQLFHDHEFLVPGEDTENFLFDSKTGVRVPLTKKLIGTAEIDFEWDNDPEPGINEDDTEYKLKLGYEW